MNTKFVYVLASSDKDVYLEQTLISLYSLKKYNEWANVVLIVDKETNRSLEGTRAGIKKYVNQIVTVDTPISFDNQRKSRYIKTSVRNVIDGDFLFIDSDTVIARDLSDVDEIPYDIAAVADKHVLVKDHPTKDIIKKQIGLTGLEFDENLPYINSGVVFVRDNAFTRKFYAIWHKKWLEIEKKGQTLDQPPLAWTDNELSHPVKFLDDSWNCQIMDNGLRFLLGARIIHYFASSKNSDGQAPYAVYDKRIYNAIKKNGDVTPDVERMVENPYSCFIPVCRIIAGDDMKILDCEWYRIVYKQYPKFFKITERLSVFVMKVLRKLKVAKFFMKVG
ncbi:Lipopolysaccharide biosynthesis protein, LPS:glycosyltransferase [Fibrobacter sp. UWR3]|uniref:glycosyltransferase n=1 Tax=Fibrobacter sp. UWR3 TaxID=1896217 RepID=UPI0009212AC6|nr:glycosyltransferase [Fibrobacter sp. UWR3]SHN08002.1 Lipopolysaccharide biosynthesis protein, LPS:glycosyltransferase [Fibrobacter sp. UWR3]